MTGESLDLMTIAWIPTEHSFSVHQLELSNTLAAAIKRCIATIARTLTLF